MDYYFNADDFGLRHSKTAAIDEAFCNGWIQEASIVVNTDNFLEAVSLAEAHGYQDRINFHLNLSQGFPLTDDIRDTILCKENGSFIMRKERSILRHCMSSRAIKAIRKECGGADSVLQEQRIYVKSH